MTARPDRHHYVFLAACGCPIGLTEATPNRPGGKPRLANEDAAWESMYTRAEERAARAAGVTAVHVDHDTYIRGYCPGMLSGCPHQAANRG